jgi:hypothetical protein
MGTEASTLSRAAGSASPSVIQIVFRWYGSLKNAA